MKPSTHQKFKYLNEVITFKEIRPLAIGTSLINHYKFSRSLGGYRMFTIDEWNRLLKEGAVNAVN